jgi:hypothetical protein
MNRLCVLSQVALMAALPLAAAALVRHQRDAALVEYGLGFRRALAVTPGNTVRCLPRLIA